MRYIDADALKTDILMKYKGNWDVPCSSEDRLIQRVVTDLRVLIEKSITADVVPKSEVAREIFKEMQSCLVMRHWHGHDILSFEFDAVKYSELKNKYTGEQT